MIEALLKTAPVFAIFSNTLLSFPPLLSPLAKYVSVIRVFTMAYFR